MATLVIGAVLLVVSCSGIALLEPARKLRIRRMRLREERRQAQLAAKPEDKEALASTELAAWVIACAWCTGSPLPR